MLGNAEIGELRELVQRYTSVTAADGELPDGYFRIDAGKNSRSVKKVAAKIDWRQDPEKVLGQLTRQVDAARGEHKVVFVRAVPRGDEHPSESKRFEGDPDPEVDSQEEQQAIAGANASAIALGQVALQQDRRTGMLVETVVRLLEDRTQVEVERALYAYHSMAVASSGNSELLGKAIETMGPALAESLPAALEVLMRATSGKAAASPGAAPAPAEPGPAIAFHVAAILRGAESLIRVVSTSPREVVIGSVGELEKLRALLQRIGPLLGLQVGPVPSPPPPAEPPPADPEVP